MLIESNQGSQSEGGHDGKNDRRRGAVAFEDFVVKNLWNPVGTGACRLQLEASLIRIFTLHQGLRLGEEIGQEDLKNKKL